MMVQKQIFEMNTLSYYIDKMQEFDITMNLDGLNSKFKYSIPIINNNNDDDVKSGNNTQLNPYEIRKYY